MVRDASAVIAGSRHRADDGRGQGALAQGIEPACRARRTGRSIAPTPTPARQAATRLWAETRGPRPEHPMGFPWSPEGRVLLRPIPNVGRCARVFFGLTPPFNSDGCRL